MLPVTIKSKSCKMSKSNILIPAPSKVNLMSLKCEQPLDELTIQVWLLYDHLNHKNSTLCVSGTPLRTYRQTDGRTNGQTIRLLDAPGGYFRPGHNKTNNGVYMTHLLLQLYMRLAIQLSLKLRPGAFSIVFWKAGSMASIVGFPLVEKALKQQQQLYHSTFFV